MCEVGPVNRSGSFNVLDLVPLYSTPIRPGMTSPIVQASVGKDPVIERGERESSPRTTMSPFVGTLPTQLPPTSDCSVLCIQVKVHVLR